MSIMKATKGSYGYIGVQRKKAILRTILLFGLALALFGIGIWSTGSKKNLLSVVAVLGCLPASRSAVGMIVFLKAKGCSEGVWQRVRNYSEGLCVLYDMVFTSYDKTYQVSHMAIKGNVVLGLTEDGNYEQGTGEKHLDTYLKQGGCKGVVVKLYQDVENYCKALESLEMQAEKEEGQLAEILENLLAIAL